MSWYSLAEIWVLLFFLLSLEAPAEAKSKDLQLPTLYFSNQALKVLPESSSSSGLDVGGSSDADPSPDRTAES